MEIKGRRTATGAAVMPPFGPEPAEAPAFVVTPAAPAAPDPPPSDALAPDEFCQLGREAMAALAESQAALVHGLETMSDEVAGLTRSVMEIVARTATDMLGVKTFSDAFKVNAVFARASFEGMVDGAAKLSGLGAKVAAESSRPILTQLGQGWIKAVWFAL
jgi:phasin protein